MTSSELVEIDDLAEPLLAGRSNLNRMIFKTLCDFRLSNMADEDGYPYPLVDLCSNPAPADISTGWEELGALADDIVSAIQPLLSATHYADWQPIETAPKDGKCLLWCETDDGGEMRVLDRDGKGNWLYEGEPTFCTSFYIEPTHWMPLPGTPHTSETE